MSTPQAAAPTGTAANSEQVLIAAGFTPETQEKLGIQAAHIDRGMQSVTRHIAQVTFNPTLDPATCHPHERVNCIPHMATLLTPGKIGEAELDLFTVSERSAAIQNLSCALNGKRRDGILPGTYARLSVAGTLMMTDTPMERITNSIILASVHGRVLIGGLGMGMLLTVLPHIPAVTEVLVLEKSADVAALIGPQVAHAKVRIEVADVFTWKPPKGSAPFDTVYMDIWPDTNCNEQEQAKLRRKYSRLLNQANPRRIIRCWRQEDY